ncbi:Sec-independent protein translocase subunit TatA/TatB [Tessaracoccus sp. Z1128]
MPTLLFALGGMEWVIILIVALLLFGGSRLAGLGKGVGRSIREFKEEVKVVEPKGSTDEVVDAEIVQPEIDRKNNPEH